MKSWYIPVFSAMSSSLSATVYDLERLNTGPLVGQDGWSGSSPIQVVKGVGINTTKVLANSVNEAATVNSRLNNVSYSFDTLRRTDTNVILQMDYHWESALGELWFGVGGDLNADGFIDPGRERGFGFGHYHNGVVITRAGETSLLNGGLTNISAAPGDMLRLRLLADLTAFGGDGSGSLFYQNLSRGDLGFTLVRWDQNLNLLENDNSAESFNGVFLAQSSGIQSDNFLVVREPVNSWAATLFPEPSGSRVVNQSEIAGVITDRANTDLTQSFTLPSAGALSAIGFVFGAPAGTPWLRVSLYRVSGGIVGASALATTTLPSEYFSQIGAQTIPIWGYAEFAEPVQVAAREQIAFRIESPFVELWGPRTNVLPGASLVEIPETDLAFRAYLAPPVIISISKNDSTVALLVQGTPGTKYQLQSSDDLVTFLNRGLPQTAAANGQVQLADPAATPGLRFYRAYALP